MDVDSCVAMSLVVSLRGLCRPFYEDVSLMPPFISYYFSNQTYTPGVVVSTDNQISYSRHSTFTIIEHAYSPSGPHSTILAFYEVASERHLGLVS